MTPTSRSLLFIALALASSAVAACSSGGDSAPAISKPDPVVAAPSKDISVFPDKVFVGVDESGKALGSAPVGLTGGSASVTWSSSSAGVASASGNEKSGKISAVKAGTAKVTVKSGTKTATVDVTVIAYKSADQAKGKTEYEAAKCADCHGASGPDVTPSGLGKHDDDEILGAVVDSKNPEGGELEGAHKYTATAAIVAYLRSLPARTDTPIKDN